MSPPLPPCEPPRTTQGSPPAPPRLAAQALVKLGDRPGLQDRRTCGLFYRGDPQRRGAWSPGLWAGTLQCGWSRGEGYRPSPPGSQGGGLCRAFPPNLTWILVCATAEGGPRWWGQPPLSLPNTVCLSAPPWSLGPCVGQFDHPVVRRQGVHVLLCHRVQQELGHCPGTQPFLPPDRPDPEPHQGELGGDTQASPPPGP